MTAVGDARKRQAVENTRRVRVTVEGDAVGWPGSSVLRVYVGASQVVTVDPSWHGVSVEDAQLERHWTDGDVVASNLAAYMRRRGSWRGSSEAFPDFTFTDGEVETELSRDNLTLLRYQAGE